MKMSSSIEGKSKIAQKRNFKAWRGKWQSAGWINVWGDLKLMIDENATTNYTSYGSLSSRGFFPREKTKFDIEVVFRDKKPMTIVCRYKNKVLKCKAKIKTSKKKKCLCLSGYYKCKSPNDTGHIKIYRN